MARTRRRMTRSPGRRRRRADWVYRPDIHDSAGALSDDLGSYQPTGSVVTAGIAGSLFKCLYDSHNRVGGSRSPVIAGNFGGPPYPGVMRAEGARAVIHRVQGTVIVTPSVWALGSVYFLGIRFGMFEMDPASPAILIDPLYNMWGQGTAIQSKPAVWANDRMWDREFHHAESFNDNNLRKNFRFNFRVRRRLPPGWCYGMYVETSVGSETVTVIPLLRTLVTDEG